MTILQVCSTAGLLAVAMVFPKHPLPTTVGAIDTKTFFLRLTTPEKLSPFWEEIL
jgi:hypothetical protein